MRRERLSACHGAVTVCAVSQYGNNAARLKPPDRRGVTSGAAPERAGGSHSAPDLAVIAEVAPGCLVLPRTREAPRLGLVYRPERITDVIAIKAAHAHANKTCRVSQNARRPLIRGYMAR